MTIAIFQQPAAPKQRIKRPKAIRQWTVVALRKRTGKGYRIMFEAEGCAAAHKRALCLCRERRVQFVAVFPGHMAALEVVK